MTETIVHRFCFQCDQERAIDPETFRCQTCGKPTARGEVVERLRAETAVRTNGTAVSAPAEPLELPNTAAMRKWIDQMHALAEGFAASAAKKRERATQLASEAATAGPGTRPQRVAVAASDATDRAEGTVKRRRKTLGEGLRCMHRLRALVGQTHCARTLRHLRLQLAHQRLALVTARVARTGAGA